MADVMRTKDAISARPNFCALRYRSNATIAIGFGLAIVMNTAGPIPPASAHAYLDHANPAVNSSVSASPPVIKLWFTSRVQRAFSTITVTDRDNRRVDLDDVSLPSSDGTELDIGLKSVPPGAYTVHWHVLAIDGHSTEGSFTFSVREPR